MLQRRNSTSDKKVFKGGITDDKRTKEILQNRTSSNKRNMLDIYKWCICILHCVCTNTLKKKEKVI